jgi:hypothetical protein
MPEAEDVDLPEDRVNFVKKKIGAINDYAGVASLDPLATIGKIVERPGLGEEIAAKIYLQRPDYLEQCVFRCFLNRATPLVLK